MNRWLKRLLVLLGIALVILVLRLTMFKPEPIPVSVYRVDRGRVESTVVNSRAGTIESRLQARMSPGISGLVSELPAKKGQRVKKGDVLLRLDDREYRAQVKLAERSLDAARASKGRTDLVAEQAQRELTRGKALYADKLLSETKLEQLQTEAEVAAENSVVARETVRQALASLDMAQTTLAKTAMIAPFDGVVLDITTELGEWISPSPPGVHIPPVIDLIDPESLYVTAPLDEADIALIRVGLPVRISLEAFRDQTFPGVLTYVSSYVETRQEQNRTLPVEAEFAEGNLPTNLLAGISTDIEVILEAKENVLRIPTYALLEDQVLVVEDNQLKEVDVEVGLRNWSFVEILNGLKVDDLVVTSLDREEIKPGAKVTIQKQDP